MNRLLKPLLGLALALVLCSAPVSRARASEDIPRMPPEELKAKLESPELVVIDVRVGPSWVISKEKIKGAVREDPLAVDSWADKYSKDKTIVLYCS